MYANIDGFMSYMGARAVDWFNGHLDADRLLADCEVRVAAYIVPNTPRCDEQVKAFENAVYAQLDHETNPINAQLADMPSEVSSFSVNGFSATLKENSGGTMFPLGISKRTKAELMLSGLLFRGVSIC